MNEDKSCLNIALIFLTVLGVLFYYFIHSEKSAEIRDLESKIAESKQEIILINDFKNKRQNIDEEISVLAKRHFRIKEAFPEILTDENIVEILSETAKNHRLDVLLLNVVDTKEEKKTFIKVFHIRAQGDYFNVLDFMYELNNYPLFLDAKRFYLKSDAGSLILDMEINCYFSNNKTR